MDFRGTYSSESGETGNLSAPSQRRASSTYSAGPGPSTGCSEHTISPLWTVPSPLLWPAGAQRSAGRMPMGSSHSKSCVWDWLEKAVKLRMQGPTEGHRGQHFTPSLQNCRQSASARDWSKPAAPRSNTGGDSNREHQTSQYLSQACQLRSFGHPD